MVGESLAIIAVILIMAFMFMRSQKKTFGVLVLPLISISLFHLIGRLLHPVLGRALERNVFLFGSDVVGLIVGVVLCVLLSRGIPTRKGRSAYVAFSGFFLLALTGAYMLNLF